MLRAALFLTLLASFVIPAPSRGELLFKDGELWDKDAEHTPAASLVTQEYRVSKELHAKLVALQPRPAPKPGWSMCYDGGLIAPVFPPGRFEMFSKSSSTLIVKATAPEHQRIKQALERLAKAK